MQAGFPKICTFLRFFFCPFGVNGIFGGLARDKKTGTGW